MGRKNLTRANRFFNRELSWLQFNQRVLDMACDPHVPLLERVRFLGITSSNLDEFFMVRVGGLQMLAAQGVSSRDIAGMRPDEQLRAIRRGVLTMVERQEECYRVLEESLAAEGIRRLRRQTLSEEQRHYCRLVFEREIYPVLSPLALNGVVQSPLLSNRVLYLVARLQGDGRKGRMRVAAIPLARPLSRLITMPSEGGYAFVLLEDLVSMFAERCFEGTPVGECVPIRITRNADLSVREDLASDLLAAMEAILDRRKRSDCVRLELGGAASRELRSALMRWLGVADDAVYRTSAPLDLSGLTALCELKGRNVLRYEPWPPQMPPAIPPGANITDVVRRRDLLLCHPFDSFEPVVRFIQQAAADPDVVAIKQVLYRTSRQSPITAALAEAARSGKHVTAVVELKARFDEARNIEWAQELEDAGVQVVYGVRGLKTHAKVCIVVRREGGELRRYVHFGTGNYNELTARLYTDVSYMTADDDLGADASSFFNAITGFTQPREYHRIAAAPVGLRERIIGLVEAEAQNARQGRPAFIRAKLNSLADERVIEALYEASQAGVNVELNVRGICCLRPGVPGLSANIRVRSIVDRFLEHSRIFCFCNRGEPKVFISSADWMPRNFDRRVELLVPVADGRCRERLLAVLDACLADNVNAWFLRPDGTYERCAPGKHGSRIRSQETTYRQACAAAAAARRTRPTVFEPYRPDRTAN